MKTLISSLFVLTIWNCFSQGNLEFNQVISLGSGSSYTVPANKVCKIESLIQDGTATLSYVGCSGACNYNGTACTIDGINFRLSSSTSTSNCLTCPASNNSSNNFINLTNYIFPYWLPAGKSVSISANTGIKISIIEFNIVP